MLICCRSRFCEHRLPARSGKQTRPDRVGTCKGQLPAGVFGEQAAPGPDDRTSALQVCNSHPSIEDDALAPMAVDILGRVLLFLQLSWAAETVFVRDV